MTMEIGTNTRELMEPTINYITVFVSYLYIYITISMPPLYYPQYLRHYFSLSGRKLNLCTILYATDTGWRNNLIHTTKYMY